MRGGEEPRRNAYLEVVLYGQQVASMRGGEEPRRNQ